MNRIRAFTTSAIFLSAMMGVFFAPTAVFADSNPSSNLSECNFSTIAAGKRLEFMKKLEAAAALAERTKDARGVFYKSLDAAISAGEPEVLRLYQEAIAIQQEITTGIPSSLPRLPYGTDPKSILQALNDYAEISNKLSAAALSGDKSAVATLTKLNADYKNLTDYFKGLYPKEYRQAEELLAKATKQCAASECAPIVSERSAIEKAIDGLEFADANNVFSLANRQKIAAELAQSIMDLESQIEVKRIELSKAIGVQGEAQVIKLQADIRKLQTSVKLAQNELRDIMLATWEKYKAWGIPYDKLKNEFPEVYDAVLAEAGKGDVNLGAKLKAARAAEGCASGEYAPKSKSVKLPPASAVRATEEAAGFFNTIGRFLKPTANISHITAALIDPLTIAGLLIDYEIAAMAQDDLFTEISDIENLRGSMLRVIREDNVWITRFFNENAPETEYGSFAIRWQKLREHYSEALIYAELARQAHQALAYPVNGMGVSTGLGNPDAAIRTKNLISQQRDRDLDFEARKRREMPYADGYVCPIITDLVCPQDDNQLPTTGEACPATFGDSLCGGLPFLSRDSSGNNPIGGYYDIDNPRSINEFASNGPVTSIASCAGFTVEVTTCLNPNNGDYINIWAKQDGDGKLLGYLWTCYVQPGTQTTCSDPNTTIRNVCAGAMLPMQCTSSSANFPEPLPRGEAPSERLTPAEETTAPVSFFDRIKKFFAPSSAPNEKTYNVNANFTPPANLQAGKTYKSNAIFAADGTTVAEIASFTELREDAVGLCFRVKGFGKSAVFGDLIDADTGESAGGAYAPDPNTSCVENPPEGRRYTLPIQFRF